MLPGIHRSNVAENLIQTLKYHFTSIMYGVADEIPIGIWYELLPQVDLTLNMLRQSNLSHNVSSHSHLTGPHGFNKIPFTPLECIVLIHNNPGKQLM